MGPLSIHQPLQVFKETHPGEVVPFHSGIVNPILDIIGQIQNLDISTTALSNYGPVGSTKIDDQMEAITWGALGGLPIIGIYVSGIGYVTGRESNWQASVATMGLTSLVMYYIWPNAAKAYLEWQMAMLVRASGWGPPRADMSKMSPAQKARQPHIEWAPPMWVLLAISYGYWHSITKEPGAKGTVGMTPGAIPPSQHQGGPVWEHLERTHG